jgi:hypothetical protein
MDLYHGGWAQSVAEPLSVSRRTAPRTYILVWSVTTDEFTPSHLLA